MMILFFSLFISMVVEAQTPQAQRACAKIERVYGSCGAAFGYDGETFEFEHGSTKNAVACSDGRVLEFYDRIESMDIASILMIPYLPGSTPLPEVRRNWDPGRLRNEELLKTMYGDSEESVRLKLVPVEFLGQTIRFQRALGAAAALERVGRELGDEALRDPSLAEFLVPFTTAQVDLRTATFFWRNIAGTTRMSTHSFGTAIDLNTNVWPQYWLWDEQRFNPEKAARGEVAYREDHYIPRAAPQFHPKAVAIFERNGFIWGGKWNHYDTMHFEYRPELFRSVAIDCNRHSGEGVPVAPLFGLSSDHEDMELIRRHVPREVRH